MTRSTNHTVDDTPPVRPDVPGFPDTPDPPGVPPEAMQTNPQQTLVIITEMGKMARNFEDRVIELTKQQATTNTRSVRNEDDIGEVKAVAAIHARDYNNFREVLAASTGKASGVQGWINSRAVGIGTGAGIGGTIAIYLLYYFGKWMGWL